MKNRKKQFKEKQTIGKKTSELLNDNDTIIIDSGSTIMEVDKSLSQFSNLTIITNALNIASQLVELNNVKAIMLGGLIRTNSLSLIGPKAV